MIPKCQGRERLMQMEGCFMKDGKASICLCFKEKNRYVLCVMRRCRSSKSITLRRPFDTKNGATYAKFSLQEKQQIAKELKGKLRSQQNVFTKASTKNDAAVKASFIVAEEIARASKSFSEGTFLKQCMLQVCPEQVCPEQVCPEQVCPERLREVG
ncbi:hypothetical protein AMELA_G00146060, partial [Ameiurus melas]